MGKRLIDIAAFLATVGAAVLAVVALKEFLDKFATLPSGYKIMTSVGIVLIAVALLCTAAWILRQIVNQASQFNPSVYSVELVLPSKLDDVYDFCDRVLDGQVAERKRLHEWHGKNPKVLFAVNRNRSSRLRQRTETVGFFSVFPITKEAAKLFSANDMKGTELRAEHILPSGRTPTALYIGGVGARGFKARQQTLAALMGFVASSTNKSIPVYTRPVTPDGRRLVRRYGFQPVVESADTEDTIWVRELAMTSVPPTGSNFTQVRAQS